MTIIWCMFPEIWSTTDRIFGHSGLFFALLPPIDPENMKLWKNEEKKKEDIIILHMFTIMTIIWWKTPEIWSVTDKIFCHFGPFFALLPLPPHDPKNQNFKNEKKPGDIIMLHMCTKNNDHMIYGSWNMVHKGQTDMWADGHTDRKTDKHINVGAPPNNTQN